MVSREPGSPSRDSQARGARNLVSLLSGDIEGLVGRPVDVQVHVSRHRHPGFTIVGLPGKSTRESRDRICAAIRNSGYRFPNARILVNLAPAAQEKQGAGFDLPVALGILLASGQVPEDRESSLLRSDLERMSFIGELGLEGALRPVRGALVTADALARRGAVHQVVPRGNAEEVALIDTISVYAVDTLRGAVRTLCGDRARPSPAPGLEATSSAGGYRAHPDFRDVRGQEATKRGLLIAAAGNHNVLMYGPPGVGKTMLARRLPGILPPLSPTEALEVLRIRSVLYETSPREIPPTRPFRAPHHTISYAGMVGGGSTILPGEVTRAHRGVLFVDEFPEFSRSVLEALREPLEAGEITIARSQGSVTFPAEFLLVAAMNPCPCGYLGHPRRACRCTPRQVQSYRQRISGPLSDRVDIHLQLGVVEPERILSPHAPTEDLDSAGMARHVASARREQARRWGPRRTNSRSDLRALVGRGRAATEALSLLRAHAERLALSARGFARTLRVARSIADVDGSPRIEVPHVFEALQFREPPPADATW